MNSFMAEIIKKKIFENKIFINKLLYLIIIDSISKIGNGHVVENRFPKKMNRDLLESHHFLNLARIDKKISLGKNKID